MKLTELAATLWIPQRIAFGPADRPRGQWPTGGVVLVGLFALLMAIPLSKIRVVTTPSVPLGVYYTSPMPKAKRLHNGLIETYGGARVGLRGKYVTLLAVDPAAPSVLREGVLDGWLPSRWKHTPLMKRVVAVGGDVVTYEEGAVRVNGKALPHSAHLAFSEQGRPLPCPSYPFVLAADEVWLASEHARGFDSRYFGPASVHVLRRTAERIWTW